MYTYIRPYIRTYVPTCIRTYISMPEHVHTYIRLYILIFTPYKVTIGVLTTSQQMLTEFELTHEEIVTRRQLLLGGGRGEGGGVDQDLSTSMMSPRLSMSLQSADKSGRNSKMDKGKATGKKDLGKKDDNRKKDDQKGKRSKFPLLLQSVHISLIYNILDCSFTSYHSIP